MDTTVYATAIDTWDAATENLAEVSAAALPGEPLTGLALARKTAHKRLDDMFDAAERDHLTTREEAHDGRR